MLIKRKTKKIRSNDGSIITMKEKSIKNKTPNSQEIIESKVSSKIKTFADMDKIRSKVVNNLKSGLKSTGRAIKSNLKASLMPSEYKFDEALKRNRYRI